ncbi:MAG: chemotaxis protein CheA [Spirochaetes bacterium]|nr:chemotaxis protein CheA [Spirochaetota bacterium]
MGDTEDRYHEEMKKDFFDETDEMLRRLEENVLHLEKHPGDLEAINEVFRAAHTIKGGSATVGFADIQTFTHALEDTLSEIRSGKVTVDDRLADKLLKCLDILTTLVDAARDGKPYPGDMGKALQLAHSLIEGAPAAAPVKRSAPTPPPESAPVPAQGPELTLSGLDPAVVARLEEAVGKGLAVHAIRLHYDPKGEMAGVAPAQAYARFRDAGEILFSRPTVEELQGEGSFEITDFLVASSLETAVLEETARQVDSVTQCRIQLMSLAKSEASAGKPTAAPEGDEPEAPGGARKNASTSVLRVDSERVDKILNLVGELTVNKSSYAPLDASLQLALMNLTTMLEQRKNRQAEGNQGDDEALSKELEAFRAPLANLREVGSSLRTAWQELDRISANLRELVMKIRMVTVGQIFNRIPRVVRDLARERGKEIEVIITGDDTEMDKSVVEELLDPMIHLVRNSVDHGIEDPATRVKLGKNPKGRLHLAARHEGNTIILEISDDGKGMDAEAIYQSAVRKGVIEAGTTLSERERIQLIFLPGFSTAKEVTAISGRGVGMDVVRKRMEALSGTIAIETEIHRGSTIVLKLPLTLTIMQALLVQCASETYAIPISSIHETLRLGPGEIKTIEGRDVITVREELISVVRVHRVFNLPEDEAEDMYAVIVTQEDNKVALLVDQLISEMDIVIKALKNRLLPARGVAGAANLGDGTITFILDIHTFVGMALERERGHQAGRAAIRING